MGKKKMKYNKVRIPILEKTGFGALDMSRKEYLKMKDEIRRHGQDARATVRKIVENNC